jgi:hypothetical protein
MMKESDHTTLINSKLKMFLYSLSVFGQNYKYIFTSINGLHLSVASLAFGKVTFNVIV